MKRIADIFILICFLMITCLFFTACKKGPSLGNDVPTNSGQIAQKNGEKHSLQASTKGPPPSTTLLFSFTDNSSGYRENLLLPRAGLNFRAEPKNEGSEIIHCTTPSELPEGLELDSNCAIHGKPLWPFLGNVMLTGTDANGVTQTTTVRLAVLQRADIAIGPTHACFLLSNSQVICSGDTGKGQQGRDTLTARTDIREIPNFEGIAALYANFETTFAIHEDGSVFKWGGDGDEEKVAKAPQLLHSISGANMIDGSLYHFCSSLRGGSIYCGGKSGRGRLGTGNMNESIDHYQFEPPTPAVGIASTENLSYALLMDGSLLRWGSVAGEPQAPHILPDYNNVIAVYSNNQKYCALYSDHTVNCHEAQNTAEDSTVPPEIQGNTVALAIGNNHSCALYKPNEGPQLLIKCWGTNLNHQLGKKNLNQFFEDKAQLRSIAVGDTHTCVGLEDGEVYCWGRNSNGLFASNVKAGEGRKEPQKSHINLLRGLELP